jgi:3',5'-cyclic AMP phosphodiesterase CpdA
MFSPVRPRHKLTDIHQDIMHDGPQLLQAFKDGAIHARVDMAVQLGDFCQPTTANRSFLAEWEALDVPRYNVLGNHDMEKNTGRERSDPALVYYWCILITHFTAA